MRIAIYAGCFKENQDGATKTLYKLADALLAEAHDTGIWAYALSPKKHPGLMLHLLPSLPLPLYSDYRIALPILRTLRQLENFRPDVIHVTVPDFAGLAISQFAVKRRIPAIASFHTDFASYFKYYHLSFTVSTAWRYGVWFYNRFRWVYAPTEVMAAELRRRGIKNVRLWSRGIDRDFFHPRFRSEDMRRDWGADGKKVILFAGRFAPFKDLDVFVQVYKLFNMNHLGETVFVLAGDGPLKEKLMEEMPKAIFTGYLPPRELGAAYASADVFLFPSTTETLGNVVQEALSSGLPAVVSDAGGCSEIVEKADGGLVARAGRSEDFFEYCLRLIRDESFYLEKRENGLKFADTRSWEAINQRLISDYRTLIPPG